MAVDRQGGNIIWCCDSCDETFEVTEAEGFESGWAQAKRGGWSCRKIAGEFLHGCPTCGVPT